MGAPRPFFRSAFSSGLNVELEGQLDANAARRRAALPAAPSAPVSTPTTVNGAHKPSPLQRSFSMFGTKPTNGTQRSATVAAAVAAASVAGRAVSSGARFVFTTDDSRRYVQRDVAGCSRNVLTFDLDERVCMDRNSIEAKACASRCCKRRMQATKA